MNLIEDSKRMFSNGDGITRYKLENLQTSDELADLIRMIEEKYGELNDIKCVQKNEQDEIVNRNRFNSTAELFQGVNNFLEYDAMELKSKFENIIFLLKIKERMLVMTDYRKTLGPKNPNPTYKYYEDDYGNVIRYDGNRYYRLNPENGNWFIDNDIVRKMRDSQYTFTEIEYEEEAPHLSK